MKKIYTFICASALALLSTTANAITINVSVGPSGSLTFSPSTFNATVGDVVMWTLASGTHTTTSTTVPTGAATWDSGTLTSSFSYTITVAGSYAYKCTFHSASGMVGGFVAAAAMGIGEPSSDLITSAYPNPFNDKLTIKYKGIQSVEVFNAIGEQVRTLELSASDAKVEMDLTGLPSGIYFYRTYKEGTIVETKKVVKAN